MARMKRTNDELKRASLAVQYELMSLYSSHELLQSSNVSWNGNNRGKAVSNALLHAMLLAARNLITFLYSYKPYDSDMIAEDFFADPEMWRRERTVASPEIADGTLIGQISKRLAHLTWERADKSKPLWGAFPIVWSIVLGLQSFVQLVDAAKIHISLSTDVALASDQLKSVLDQHPEWIGLMAPPLASMHFDELEYFGDETPGPGSED